MQAKLPFKSLEDYGEVVREMGRGGYSTVSATSKGYALKVSKNYKDYIPSEDIIKEAAALRKVQSKYVVPLIDVIIEKENTTLVLPLAKASMRQDWVYHSLPSKKIVRDMCMGLAAIHNANLLHLDVKPDNFLISGLGTDNVHAWISDLGLSLVHTCAFSPLRTSEDTVYYTLWYRPLEACIYSTVTEKSDVWALGVTLTEFFLSKEKGWKETLFPSDSNIDQIYKMVRLLGTPDIESNLIPKKYFANIARGVLSENGLTDEELDLVLPMLELNPARRPSIFEVLQSPYFNPVQRNTPQEWTCFEKLHLDEGKYPPNNWNTNKKMEVATLFSGHVVVKLDLKYQVLALSMYLSDRIVASLETSQENFYYYNMACIVVADMLYSEYPVSLREIYSILDEIYGQSQDLGPYIKTILEASSFDLTPVTAYIYMSRVFLEDPSIRRKATSLWLSILKTEERFTNQLELADRILIEAKG